LVLFAPFLMNKVFCSCSS